MRYIRFLKAPRFEGAAIKALLAITSDLGEDLLSSTCELAPVLRIAPGHERQRDLALPRQTWAAGARTLAIVCVPPPDAVGAGAAAGTTTYQLAVCAVASPRSAGACGVNRLPGADGGDQVADCFPLVLSVVSDSFSRAAGAASCSQREFGLAEGRVLRVWENSGDSIEGHIWDAGYAAIGLFNHIISTRLRRDKDSDVAQSTDALALLELGCGTGLVGLFLASAVPHCTVTLTDLASATELVQRNIATMTQQQQSATGSSAHFSVLQWGAPLSSTLAEQQWDLLLASDVNYNPDSAQALVSSIGMIQEQCPQILVLVASKRRHESESVFSRLMAQSGFVVHNEFRIVLPTDHCAMVDMWVGESADPMEARQGDEQSGDAVVFTLYTKSDIARNSENREMRSHVLSDLWVPYKRWTRTKLKRQNDMVAKTAEKSRPKRRRLAQESGS